MAKESALINRAVRKFYSKEGPYGVRKRLAKMGIKRSEGRLEKRAYAMHVRRRDPKIAETIRRVIKARYRELGPRGTTQLLKKEHRITVTVDRVRDVASNLGVHSEDSPLARADKKKSAEAKAEQEKQEVLAFYERLKSYLVKSRRVRNRQVTDVFKAEKRQVKGFLTTLVEKGKLVRMNDLASDCVWYFDADPGFYKDDELASLIPEAELGRIRELAFEIIKGGGTHSVSKLASQVFPDQVADEIVGRILPKLLEELIELDIVAITPAGHYKKGVLYDAVGGDPESVRVLRRIGQIIMGRLEEKRREFRTPEDIIALRKESMNKLLVKPLDLSTIVKLKGPLNILFATGMPEGHILTSEEFFNACLKNIQAHPELGPDIVVANDFVQGNFLFEDIMRGLTLDDFAGLDTIDRQIEAANVWFQYLQGLPRNKVLLIGESVNEKRTGKGYALAQMLKGQQWYKVFGLNLSVPRQRFAKNKFFFHLFKFQTEVVITYWLRIGRAPMNQAQMDEVAKKRKLELLNQSEDIALVNIYWTEMFSDKKLLAGLSPEERKKTERVVADVKKKYAGWVHRTPPPTDVRPRSDEFQKLWAKYAGPVNLHALMAEEEKKMTA